VYNFSKRFFLPTLLSLLIIWPSYIRADHIIGGELTYRCLGGGRYEITMKIYRDCLGGGAEFDSNPGSTPGTVTIYRGDSNEPFIETIQLDPPVVTDIEPDENPCLVLPPNLCVEEGVYTFTVDLPLSGESYHIVYQRCCRNRTINNILDPGDSGATYTVEITPLAQETCNDSPVFNEFPPIVICVGEPLIFDHSATDNDTATQLVYEFCTPFLGGGTDGVTGGTGSPFSFTGIAPNPDAPPPFDPVNFRLPAYSFNRPLGGDPVVSIDPNTGLITGTPIVEGQFVVGVCVREFLDGELLSTVRRDFQFNVTSCERRVFADLDADFVDGQEFVIQSCGSNTVFFDNQSTQEQFIEEYYWEFDIDGNLETFDERDLTITFPGLGTYEGTMIINRNSLDKDCRDTANITVNVYPDIDAAFTFDYDTCDAGDVVFTDFSTTGSGQMTGWSWDYGDGNSSDLQNPQHFYEVPGEFPVTLTVTDINECLDDTTLNVRYFPVPRLIVIEPSQFRGCSPGEIFFNNLTVPIDETYDISWDFGDGSGGSDEISPTHTFLNPGIYDVSVNIVSPIGCETSAQFDSWIEILPGPVADFSFSPEMPNSFNNTVSFFDESLNAVGYYWDFNGEANAFIRNPVHTFQDTGKKVVTLVATRENGCTDTAVQIIDIVPELTYFLPNAFTPNGDGVNDGYRGKGIFTGITNFQMNIWNRWGEKVFETTDPNESWNGLYKNNGKPSPKGVYVCVVQFTGPRGELTTLEEFVTLIR
jgi:gliding motility-associated-like protein